MTQKVVEFTMDRKDPDQWLVLVEPPEDLLLPGLLGKLFPQPQWVVAAIIDNPLGHPKLTTCQPLDFGFICCILDAVHKEQVLMN